MSERKRSSIHRTLTKLENVFWVTYLFLWILAFLYYGIPKIGTVDCNGLSTSWLVLLGSVLALSTLFIAGYIVGANKNAPVVKKDLIAEIQSIYNKLDSKSQSDAVEFISKLHDIQDFIYKHKHQ